MTPGAALRRIVPGAPLLLLLVLHSGLGYLALGHAPVSGQTYTVMPTYQDSFAEYDPGLYRSDFRAWGMMVGLERPGHWWAPHVWVQRYEIGSVDPDDRPGERNSVNDGWSVSVGPSIQLVNTPPALVTMVSQLGLGSWTRGDFTGGGGIHVDFKVGAFRPQAFTQLQIIRGQPFLTYGVGLKLLLQVREGPGSDVFSGF